MSRQRKNGAVSGVVNEPVEREDEVAYSRSYEVLFEVLKAWRVNPDGVEEKAALITAIDARDAALHQVVDEDIRREEAAAEQTGA